MKLKSLLILIIAAAYIIAPDAVPGPIDDIIVGIVGLMAAAKGDQ